MVAQSLTITAENEKEATRIAEVLCKSQGLPVTEANTHKVFVELCQGVFKELARKVRAEETSLISAEPFKIS